jgi:adenosine deaminase
VKSKIVLELCPTSNLKNSIIPDVATLHTIYRTLIDAGVPLTINTDGPEMYRTNVVKEEVFLLNEGVMSEDEIAQCRDNAFNATFVRN